MYKVTADKRNSAGKLLDKETLIPVSFPEAQKLAAKWERSGYAVTTWEYFTKPGNDSWFIRKVTL